MSNDYTLPPVPIECAGWSVPAESVLRTYGHACAEHVRAEITPRVVEVLKERDRLRAEVEAKDARIAELEAQERVAHKFRHDLMIGQNEQAGAIRSLHAEVEALRAILDGVAKTRAPKPRTLPTVGTGALHGEQQHCYEMGYREGASAVRKAIAAKIAAPRGGGAK